jgi:hypothetical protein
VAAGKTQAEGEKFPTVPKKSETDSLHPAWRAFIRYCVELRHGEIERLCIQDGLPVLAESTTKKVKFNS